MDIQAVQIIIAPIVMGISQLLKNYGVASKYIPVANMGIGIVIGIIVALMLTTSILTGVVMGLVSGLMASGVYDNFKYGKEI